MAANYNKKITLFKIDLNPEQIKSRRKNKYCAKRLNKRSLMRQKSTID